MVGWGGGLFDYSVTPGPGLSKVKCQELGKVVWWGGFQSRSDSRVSVVS